MELKQFINEIQQNAGLRALLPVHQGMLYPYFTVTGNRLCAHFLTRASKITPEGMILYTPEYHIIAGYPQADIPCIRNLRYDPAFADTDFSQTTLLEKMPLEQREEARLQLQKLLKLADEVLEQWEQTGSAEVNAYHQQLQQVLTGQQYEMYRKVAERG